MATPDRGHHPPITEANYPEAGREVELPVCPVCGQVGKRPGSNTMTFSCMGPSEEPHKRAMMQNVLFEARP